MKMEIGYQVTETFGAALFVLYQKRALYKNMYFFDMLQHCHLAFQKGVSLRGRIDIKLSGCIMLY